jgi:N utilization substance protein A
MDGLRSNSLPAAHHNPGIQAGNSVSQWIKNMGVSDDLAAVAGLKPQHLVALGEHGVKTLDDLADLASDELLEIVGGRNMSQRQADGVIMAARAHWFE